MRVKMNKRELKLKARIIVFALVFIMIFGMNTMMVFATSSRKSSKDTTSDEDTCINNISDVIDYSEVEKLLGDISVTDNISFEDEVNKVVKEGTINYKDYLPNLSKIIKDAFIEKKDVIIKVIAITIITAIFTNFSNVMDNSYVSGTSFIVVYMLLMTLLINTFTQIYKVGNTTLNIIKSFMEAIFPVYSVASFMSNGIKTSTVYMQLTFMVITVIEIVFLRIILPLINIYLIVSLVNNLNISNDSNSVIALTRLAEFIKMIINQAIKLTVIFITSIGTIQRLIAPSVDKATKGLVSNGIKLVPFVGKGTEVVKDTVEGATVVIRNAIGGVSMIVIIIMCAMPLISVGVYVIIFEIISIIAESISDKRVTNALKGISDSAKLVIRVIGVSALLFIITIALISV